MKTKELQRFDMSRIISRMKKEFGEIAHGTEENYYPQLGYIEHAIHNIHQEYPISDTELSEVLEIVLYDLKSKIEDIDYDYSKVVTKKQIQFAKELEMLCNPFINKELSNALKNIDTKNQEDIKNLFRLPIIIILRIYDSIAFWRNYYGINGYYALC